MMALLYKQGKFSNSGLNIDVRDLREKEEYHLDTYGFNKEFHDNEWEDEIEIYQSENTDEERPFPYIMRFSRLQILVCFNSKADFVEYWGKTAASWLAPFIHDHLVALRFDKPKRGTKI